jgi:PAS domain-containing protein
MPDEENKSREQKPAEAEVESFRKELGPFVVAAETTRMPMVFMDAKEADKPIIFANDSFLALTGYPRAEVLGQSLNFLMARGADAEALRKSTPRSRAAPRVSRKFAIAGTMAASSGLPSSSAQFATRAAKLCSILPHS